MQLFAALKRVHRLPPEYAEWLSAAAMLYEVGDYVNRTGRHRHTYYIISQLGNSGITPRNSDAFIAAIARYLGKSRPCPVRCADAERLPPEDANNVRKASLLLRLARALNLGRSDAVRSAKIRVHNSQVDNLTLIANGHAGRGPGIVGGRKRKAYFREVFGRELSAAAA